MTKTVWNVAFLDENGEHIDDTQIDEKSSKLAWQLFKEFGHTKKKGYTLEWNAINVEDDE